MKRSLPLVAVILAFAFLAGGCSPVKKAGAWKLQDMNAAVVFLYFKPGKAVEVEKAKEIATRIAHHWREHFRDVRVVILNDEDFALSLADKDDKSAFVTPEGILVDKGILTRGSLNPPGGAYLHVSDKLPEMEWAFIGKEAVAKP